MVLGEDEFHLVATGLRTKSGYLAGHPVLCVGYARC